MPEMTSFSQNGALGKPHAILAERVVNCVYGRLGVNDSCSRNRERSVQDVLYHLAYLEAAMQTASPLLFLEYVRWVEILFSGLGFAETAVTDTLDCLRVVLLEELPLETGAIAHNYISQALAQQQHGQAKLPSFIEPQAPLATLAQQYMALLLQGDRRGAGRLILDAVQTGAAIKEIFLYVFQPCQREIGRLWQTNKISVAQEHYSTAATQAIMAQLYPYVFASARNGRTLVAASIQGELHELGMRMVADFFEMDGWNTYYLGANTPHSGIIQFIDSHKADVLALSVTLTPHLQSAQELIAQIRDVAPGLPIIVGGYPFNLSPDLWQQIGADGFARDAQQAVALAAELLEAKGELQTHGPIH